MRIARILLATLMGIPAAFSQSAPAVASRPITQVWKALKYAPLKPLTFPKVEELTLSNGMRVLLLENHELPLVRGIALVRTGNLFDPADKVGLASVTGDTLRSGGTKIKTGDRIDEELENVAASIESGIGESSGTVSFSCLKDNLTDVIATFRDVLTSPEFRPEKIELTKHQIMSGISRRNDDAGDIAQREFSSILYGRENSYGWDMQYATVAKIQRADVQAFYQRYFFPANILLAVQGDFETPAMKTKLEELFRGWTVKQPPVPPFPKVQTNDHAGTYLAVKEDVTQTNFVIGQLGGERKDQDYAALEVMSSILGGGFNSRLFRRLRTQLGYVYGVSANWAAAYDHPGSFAINGSTKSSTTIQALEAAREEVDRIRKEPVSEEELESAKETVLNSFVFAFDTPAKSINRLLVYYYFNYPKDFIFQYQKAVKALTRDDILKAAQKYVDPAKFIVLAVGNPKDFGKPLDALGAPVKTLDLTIPVPASMAAGKSE